MLAVRRGGVDSVRQLVASMYLMETQVIITVNNNYNDQDEFHDDLREA